MRIALWTRGPCRAVCAHRLPLSLPLASAISSCHLLCDLRSYLSYHPCRVLSLFLCSSQDKSLGLFQSHLKADPKDFCYLANCKMLFPSHFGWSVCFLLIVIWCLNTSACSSPSFMTWKSLNLFSRNCVPAHPVPSSSSPVIILKDISYLGLLILWPGMRCAHPMDFESSCQATLSLGSITISLKLIANIWSGVKCLQWA